MSQALGGCCSGFPPSRGLIQNLHTFVHLCISFCICEMGRLVTCFEML